MQNQDMDIAPQKYDADIPDYSDPDADDFVALSRDKVTVRSMQQTDLPALIRIDRKLTGMDRSAYYERKLAEVMNESGIRVSLVAEVDGLPVGYIMARVDYGEFGRAEPMAVIDTIGVEPGHGRGGVASALLSQLLANLSILHVDRVRSTLRWNNFTLMSFLARNGFKPAQRLVLRKRVD
ncbi:MAG: GNAT family N-acetyltransferase [Hyphomicrobiales bacterium]|nr:GNAT family N-acetyltransferase [Hyphomicrobiales bacterium]MCP5374318.1 GNAT family N-acetyltransferase [Hyphomicrobiales bacterium]